MAILVLLILKLRVDYTTKATPSQNASIIFSPIKNVQIKHIKFNSILIETSCRIESSRKANLFCSLICILICKCFCLKRQLITVISLI